MRQMDVVRNLRPAVIATLLSASLTGACSVIREDVGQPLLIDESALQVAADYHAVLDLLGPPHRLSRTASGMAFLYEEIDLFETQLGLNLSSGDVALFKAVLARGEAIRRLVLVSFDSDGATQAIYSGEMEGALARGAGLQFLFEVSGVVDDEDLSQSPAAHEWGYALLEPDLPVALNRASRIDGGHAGVEQQGTPKAVGQKTLELVQ
jgi:hypothetical protein